MMEKDNNDLEISFPVETPRKKSRKPKDSSHQDKASLVAILSIIMGTLGVHDFFCGNNRNGIIKLVCTFLGITAFISVIWNLIDLYKIGNGTYTTQNGINLAPCPWCKKVGLVMAAVNIAVFSIFLTQLLKFLKVF